MNITINITFTRAHRGDDDIAAVAANIMESEHSSVEVTESGTADVYTMTVRSTTSADSITASRDSTTIDLMDRLVELSKAVHIISGSGTSGEGYDPECHVGWSSDRTWYTENKRGAEHFPSSRTYFPK